MIDTDRSIYVMPSFAIFQVTDIQAAEPVYEAAGFSTVASFPGPDGQPAMVHLRRRKYQDLLLTVGQPVPGSTVVTFSAQSQEMHYVAASLSAHAPAGAKVYGPANTPWFTTDLTIEDTDGNRIVLSAPRPGQLEDARAWAKEHSETTLEDHPQ